MYTRPLLEAASEHADSGSPQLSEVAPLITMRTPTFEVVPMSIGAGEEELLHTGLPLPSGSFSLASSIEPSTVGVVVPSLTNTASTRLGAGSGTAIGSRPDIWLAWKI